MEDGLVPALNKSTGIVMTVLILIVVDDGLVPLRQVSMGAAAVVLILIVVDDGLVRVLLDL